MLNKREALGAICTSVVAAISPKSAGATEVLLSPNTIQSDMGLLSRVYTNLHPGLYRYATPTQINARFTAISQKFSQPATLAHVYLELSKLLSSIRCGHSYANFYSQSQFVQTALFSGRNRLPFKFIWLNQRMVVTDPVGIAGLARGARITRINGVATRDILMALLPYVRADGHNIGKQTSLLSVNLDEGYQTFDIFYALHFGAAEYFDIEGIASNGAVVRMRMPAIDLAARRAMTALPTAPDIAPRWQLDIRDDAIAVLTMPTWGLYRSSWDWKEWLAISFTHIKSVDVTKLIIDLRGNEGGRDDCGPEILGYLTDKPLPPQAGQRRVRYQKIPSDLNPILDTWDDSFRDWGSKVIIRSNGMYDLIDETGRSGGGIMPKSSRFGGKIIVLTDATNSSATLQFCQMLRANNLGTIIGGTTGGNLRGINAEKFMFCRLPGTGLEVDVPLVGFFPAGSPPDSGLVPDVTVKQRWQDIAAGADTILAAAIRLNA